MLKRFRRYLGWLALGLSAMGLVTFSLFILEESFQTVMFGSWAAQDAQDWPLVYEAAERMDKIVRTLETMNRWAGWIQPFAWVAYGSYAESAGYYTKALRAKVFAHSPELFEGERVEFTFRPKQFEDRPDAVVLIGREIRVRAPPGKKRTVYRVAGVVTRDEKNNLMVDLTR